MPAKKSGRGIEIRVTGNQVLGGIVTAAYVKGTGTFMFTKTPIAGGATQDIGSPLTSPNTYQLQAADRGYVIGARPVAYTAPYAAGLAFPFSAPMAPTITNVVAGNGSVTATVTRNIDNGGDTVTGDRIYAYKASDGTPLGSTAGLTMTGIANGVAVLVRVATLGLLGTGVLSAPFGPVTPTNAGPYARLQSALAAVTAGTGYAKIGLVGDSTMAGAKAGPSGTTMRTITPVTLLREALMGAQSRPVITSNFVGDQRFGFTNSISPFAFDTRLSQPDGAGYAATAATPYSVGGGLLSNSVNTNRLGFLPEVATDTTDIYYAVNTSLGAFSVIRNGGTSLAVNEAGTSATGKTTYSSPLNSVDPIYVSRTSGSTYVIGMDSYNSTIKSIRLFGMGWSGGKAADFAANVNGFDPLNALITMNMDLVVARFGTNDISVPGAATTSTDPTAYQASIVKFVDALLAQGTNVILATHYPMNTAVMSQAVQDTYAGYVRTIAAARGLQVHDTYARLGTYAAASAAGKMFDNLHPNTAGYTEDAAALSTLILSTGAATLNPTITVTPAQLSTVSGSPVLGTDFDNAPVLKLPNASNEFAFIADSAVVGQKYDVYMLWSVSATPTTLAAAGGVAGMAGTYCPASAAAGTFPSGTTRFVGIVPPQAAGVIERSQMPWSFTRENADRVCRFRWGRRADNIGGFVQIRGFELVPTTGIVSASVTDAGSVTPASFKTPYDTTKITSLLSLYTPIWSSDTAVYVVAPVTIDGVNQSRVAKLSKTDYSLIQDVQIGTKTHDTVIGHRDGSVVVTDSGKVIVHGESHATPWIGMFAPTEDISALAASAAPVGLDTHSSYRRFFRNPFDGSMWMGARGTAYTAGVWKWNDSTNQWDRKPSGSLMAGDGQTMGSYAMEMAFGDANTIYLSTEYCQGTSSITMSGYPRQNLNMIKSVDGGATWTTMRGKLLKLPLGNGTDDSEIAFPNNNMNANAAVNRIAIGPDGKPILFASWQHPDEAQRSLWMAKYNTTTNKWDRKRLLATDGARPAGTAHVAYYNGKIVLTAATYDDNNGLGINTQMYIFTSTDSGATWNKYAINHAVGPWSGAYIDPAALRIDNKLRLLPNLETQPSSVIWELPVPA